jgi:polar amino acid transport system substrate-binding protein
MGNRMFIRSTIVLAALAVSASAPAYADQLDDIISAGKLRCAVELDFPPNGARDKNNVPVGFDVD